MKHLFAILLLTYSFNIFCQSTCEQKVELAVYSFAETNQTDLEIKEVTTFSSSPRGFDKLFKHYFITTTKSNYKVLVRFDKRDSSQCDIKLVGYSTFL